MKIDKSRPQHWLLLIAFGMNVLVAILLRPFLRRAARPLILLYGHKLNGNLLAIYKQLAPSTSGFSVRFITLDPDYYQRLRNSGISSIAAYQPSCCSALIAARAVISDHGLHAMQPMPGLSSLRFFDVWHGIPFKGFDSNDFRFQRKFDEIWVASPLHKQLYIDRFGFPASKLAVTGYARTDRLVRQIEEATDLRRDFGLPEQGKIVLFAPTWAQDDRNRNIYPFHTGELEFLEALTAVTESRGATLVVRAHLNSGSGKARGIDKALAVPQSDFEDSEGLLLASDILICDWSSIAFDFLLLNRPTIFLDVPAPFRKGFSLGPEYRFGLVVQDMEQLCRRLGECLDNPQGYQAEKCAQQQRAIRTIYGDFADGRSTARCVDRLRERLS